MKFLFQPLKPFILHQGFGENKACVDSNNNVITCDGNNPPAGYRSLYGSKGHTGIDLGGWHGQEVYCAQRGVVDFIDTQPKSGLDIRIVSEFGGKKYRHIYEHLLGYQPRVGDKVETGQVIGWLDNTGYSSGDHLHFQLEVWENGQWVQIDPLAHMESIFAKDILYINNKLKWLKEQLAFLADNLAHKLRK